MRQSTGTWRVYCLALSHSLNLCVPYAVQILPFSKDTQHFSASNLYPMIPRLSPSRISIRHCLSLTAAGLLSLLRKNIVTASPSHDLQLLLSQISPNVLSKTLVFTSFAHVTYLRCANEQFQAGYSITNFQAIEFKPLSEVSSAKLLNLQPLPVSHNSTR